MFCPECGTLSFPDSSGNIKCPNYACGYHGSSENKIQVGDEEVDISKVTSSTSKAEEWDRDSRGTFGYPTGRGGLTKGVYNCSKCGCNEVYSEVSQIRAKTTTTLFECKKCGNTWQED